MMSDRDLARLQELASLNFGEPAPEWLPNNNWSTAISELCAAAHQTIIEMRAALQPFAQVGRPFIDAIGTTAIPADASARFLNLEPLVAGDLARAAKALTQQ